MAIENTPIIDEVRKVLASTEAAAWNWECEFISGSARVKPFRILSIDLVRNYNLNYGDEIQLSVLFPEGDFNTLIVPNLDGLEVTLKRSPIIVNDTTANKEKNSEVQRYRALMIDNPTPYLKGATPNNVDNAGANLNRFTTIYFQLLDRTIEQLRGISVGGIYHNTTNGEVLRTVLGRESKKINVANELAVKGVDMVAPNNTTVKQQIIIRHGIPLIDLPTYLQLECGGIYSAGMGYYLQRGIWYIYPEFDTTRFKKELKTLTIYNVPPNKFPNVEHTYRTTANQLIIIATGKLKHKDDSDNLMTNLGNGVRFTNADKVIENHGSFDNGKVTVSRVKNNSEFTAFTRATGLNQAPISDARITSNPFNEYSKLARRNCSHIQLVWENSDQSLIYPGMPCKLIYENDGGIAETEGVINQVHHFTTGEGSSLVNSRYVTHSTLTILIKPVT